MQVQPNVCILCKYGYFVVWTEGEMAMERITIDREFYKVYRRQSRMLFYLWCTARNCCKWYTRKHVTDKDRVVQPLTVYRYAVHLKINGTACHVPKVHASKKIQKIIIINF